MGTHIGSPRLATRRFLRLFGMGLAVGAVSLTTVTVHPASADQTASVAPCISYSVQSAGDGVRIEYAAENALPAVNEVDSEGPSAAALVGSGVSSAEAAALNPGSAALSAIPLVGGSLPSGAPQLDESAYPLAVESQFPTTRNATFDNQALSLQASSGDGTSLASTKGGVASAGGTTAGWTDTEATASCYLDGSATARASTLNSVLSFQGGVLRIGNISSSAAVSVDVAGKPQVTSTLTVGQTTVAGQTVELTDQSLAAGSTTVPLPTPDAGLLSQAGISLRYLKPVTDQDGFGVTSAALEVVISEPLNHAGLGTGPSTVTYTFGRAYARIDGSPPPPTQDAGPTSGALPSGGTSTDSSGGMVAPPDSVSSPTSLALVPTGKQAAPGGQSASPPPTAAPVERPTVPASLKWPDLNWKVAYLAAMVGGLLLAGGRIVNRIIRKGTTWT
jgi:hypothetical protein